MNSYVDVHEISNDEKTIKMIHSFPHFPIKQTHTTSCHSFFTCIMLLALSLFFASCVQRLIHTQNTKTMSDEEEPVDTGAEEEEEEEEEAGSDEDGEDQADNDEGDDDDDEDEEDGKCLS